MVFVQQSSESHSRFVPIWELPSCPNVSERSFLSGDFLKTSFFKNIFSNKLYWEMFPRNRLPLEPDYVHHTNKALIWYFWVSGCMMCFVSIGGSTQFLVSELGIWVLNTPSFFSSGRSKCLCSGSFKLTNCCSSNVCCV